MWTCKKYVKGLASVQGTGQAWGQLNDCLKNPDFMDHPLFHVDYVIKPLP